MKTYFVISPVGRRPLGPFDYEGAVMQAGYLNLVDPEVLPEEYEHIEEREGDRVIAIHRYTKEMGWMRQEVEG